MIFRTVAFGIAALCLSQSALAGITSVGRVKGTVVYYEDQTRVQLTGDETALDGCYKVALLAMADSSLNISFFGTRSSQPQRMSDVHNGILEPGMGCLLGGNSGAGRFGSVSSDDVSSGSTTFTPIQSSDQ